MTTAINGKLYKHFTVVIYSSRVVIYDRRTVIRMVINSATRLGFQKSLAIFDIWQNIKRYFLCFWVISLLSMAKF